MAFTAVPKDADLELIASGMETKDSHCLMSLIKGLEKRSPRVVVSIDEVSEAFAESYLGRSIKR